MDKGHDDLAGTAVSTMTILDIATVIEEITVLVSTYDRMLSESLGNVTPGESDSVFSFIEEVHALQVAQQTQLARFNGVPDRLIELAAEAKCEAAGETV